MSPSLAAPPKEDASVTLDYLMRRMRQKTDFPALAASVTRIQSLSVSDTENINTLCDELLKDVALTQKLLRVVNSARFRNAGMDPVSTVSRAVALVGMAGIRNVALSLMLVEHMEDKQHARQLQEEFLRTIMAGTVAGELCANPRVAEEAFVASMFRNLGRLLVEYYLPEEATQIRDIIREDPQKISDAVAAKRVMGIDFDDLGQAIGKEWGLPAEILGHMRAPKGPVPSRSLAAHADRITWLTSLSCDLSRTMLTVDPTELGKHLVALERQYAGALDLPKGAVSEAAFRARKKLADLTNAISMNVTPGDPAERLLDHYYVDAPNPETEGMTSAESLGLDQDVEVEVAHTDFAEFIELPGMTPAVVDPVRVLHNGIQDVANTLVGDFRLPEVLQMILETVLRALDCQRVVFCLRDARTAQLVGRIALGEGAEQIKGVFKIPLEVGKGQMPHLFSAACIKGVDTLIRNAAADNVVTRLPDWFRDRIQAPTFLLLPLIMKKPGQDYVMGMIYADKPSPESLEVDQEQLKLLNTLRNQAITAFKQASSVAR